MALIGRWAPTDTYEEVWKLWDEGLRPTSIAGLLSITLQEVYDILNDGEFEDEYEQYDEDLQ